MRRVRERTEHAVARAARRAVDERDPVDEETRRERADNVKKRNVFAKYGEKTRAVLNALLDKYADGGLKSVESLEILKVDPLTSFGTPVEIVNLFGSKKKYLAAIEQLEAELYKKAA